MRRTTALLSTVLLVPPLVLGTGSPAPAEPATTDVVAAPAVLQVQAAYGAPRVRVAPRQGVDITFRASKGDRVLLDVRSTRHRQAPCFGTQTLRDALGTRTATIDGLASAKIMTVRTTGPAVLGFRGYCASNQGQEAHPASVQLTRIRMREIGREGRRSVRAARRGFLDVAYVTVRANGRDTMTLRNGDGTTQDVRRTGRVLLDDRLVPADAAGSVSVEAGHRLAVSSSTYGSGGRLRAGERVGLVVASAGWAQSLRARVHRTSLDAPALALPAEPGREHVLVYAATDADRSYVTAEGLPASGADLGDPTWSPWRTYSGGADRTDPSLRRTIVASDPDGAGGPQLRVRVRRTVRVADLVLGGPAVTFSSTDPGTRFIATIPAAAVAGAVRLTASNVSTTGPWGTEVPPTVCPRDCLWPGLGAGPDKLSVDGYLEPGNVHELHVTFGADASGSVTLQLTDIP